MADPALLGATLAFGSAAVGAVGSAMFARRSQSSRRTGAAIAFAPPDVARDCVLTAATPPSAVEQVVAELARSTARQASAMHQLAVISAEGMRAATGTYVFQLRDRFDDSLPPAQIGLSSTTWSAVGEAPGPLELLVLHSGDTVRFVATLVCNQAPLRRVVRVRPMSPPQAGVSIGDITFTASAARAGTGDFFELPADLSLFVDVPIEIAIDGLALGAFSTTVAIEIACSDTRPEGAIARVAVELEVRGIVVADDDGVGIDAADLRVDIAAERRAYFLDKADELLLAMPTRAALATVSSSPEA